MEKFNSQLPVQLFGPEQLCLRCILPLLVHLSAWPSVGKEPHLFSVDKEDDFPRSNFCSGRMWLLWALWSSRGSVWFSIVGWWEVPLRRGCPRVPRSAFPFTAQTL